MTQTLLAAISVALLLCCIIMAEAENREEHPSAFDYDPGAPLNVSVHATSERGDGVSVVDLDFASPRGGRVPAYLVVPPGKGPFAAIVYGHWINPKNSPQTSNRSEFLEEAIALAPVGVVSLLTDAPSVRHGFTEDPDPFSSQDSDVLAQQVVDMRRAVDLLESRRDVDPKRIAYVGHSVNAAVGGVLRAVEPRFRALVLMTSAVSMRLLLLSDEPRMVEFRNKYGERRVKQYLDKFDWADPGHYVSRAGGAPVLLQVATHDEFGNEANFRRQTEIVAEPKTVEWYDAKHALNARARRDRCEWLRQNLKLQ